MELNLELIDKQIKQLINLSRKEIELLELDQFLDDMELIREEN